MGTDLGTFMWAGDRAYSLRMKEERLDRGERRARKGKGEKGSWKPWDSPRGIQLGLWPAFPRCRTPGPGTHGISRVVLLEDPALGLVEAEGWEPQGNMEQGKSHLRSIPP